MKTFQYAYFCVKITHYVFQALKEGKLYLMTVKLFVLGFPGSGKSTIARHIEKNMRDRNLSAVHISDYAILRKMFEEDTDHKQFKAAEHGGFNAIDLTVFDIALQKLAAKIKEQHPAGSATELILLEFARNDYRRALHQFSPAFLQDTYFLYLDASIDICKQRIQDRIAHPSFEDDYYVSDYIFDTYYRQDDGQYLSNILEREYQIHKQQVKIINNNDSLEAASTEINAFVHFIVATAPLGINPAGTLL